MICPHCGNNLNSKKTKSMALSKSRHLIEARGKEFRNFLAKALLELKEIPENDLYSFLQNFRHIPDDWLVKQMNNTWKQWSDKRRPFAYLSTVLRNKIDEEG